MAQKKKTAGQKSSGPKKTGQGKTGQKKPVAKKAIKPAAKAPAKKAVPVKAPAPKAPAAKSAAPSRAPLPPSPTAPPPKTAAAQPAKPAKAPKAPAVKASGPQFPKGLPGTFKSDEPLSKHTTFRIGGPAKWHFTPATAEAAATAVQWARQEKLPVLVMGLGSNVLIKDGGFKGLVLKLGKGLDTVEVRGRDWKVGAGLATPLLARRSAEAGLVGVQRLIGVPGTVGGGVFMNAGAHGQDFASVLVSAVLMDLDGKLEERPRKAIHFGYRTSGLENVVVMGCTLRLEEDSAEKAKADLALYLKKRREGTPFDQPCCGSVFKNPQIMTAGRIIERCGLKGRRVGGAEISQLHANYIVNRGGATGEDVIKLIDVARTAVFKEFGVELELEVKVLGSPA
jgi:UDP-N-acetylmuramate dehydrogenase